MRRTLLLLGVTLVLIPTLGHAARPEGRAQPSSAPVSERPALTDSVTSLPADAPSTVPGPTSGATVAPTDTPTAAVAQAEGQAEDAASVAAPAASQRPLGTAVLDPRSGVTLVAAGTTVAGDGPTYRYSVEVEPSLGLDVERIREVVEAALHDTERSWARTRTLQRIDDPAEARIRVIIASPATVDAICATVGLDTAGIFSCWTGRIAALNAWRWEVGAAGFPDTASYRTYLVNHEFGHALGYGHIGCPRAGAPAPVMMQQSKGLAGCTANGWPYP
jgi:hypothetical protein